MRDGGGRAERAERVRGEEGGRERRASAREGGETQEDLVGATVVLHVVGVVEHPHADHEVDDGADPKQDDPTHLRGEVSDHPGAGAKRATDRFNERESKIQGSAPIRQGASRAQRSRSS